MLRRGVRVAFTTPLRAQFSTTSARQVDLSNLYSKLTGWRRKTPQAAPVDPTQVPEAKRVDDAMHKESKPRKLEVLGRPNDLEEDWEEIKPFAEFTPWPTNQHRKDLTREQISAALESAKSADFSNITARFDAIKAVSEKLSLAIPDSVLTSLNSVDDLERHLERCAVKFDERQPDAVYLNPEDFVGTNITVSDPVVERRLRKRRTQELVKEAKAAQIKQTDELMQSN